MELADKLREAIAAEENRISAIQAEIAGLQGKLCHCQAKIVRMRDLVTLLDSEVAAPNSNGYDQAPNFLPYNQGQFG